MQSLLTNLVTSCLGSVQRLRDVGEREDSLLSYENIRRHAHGKYSMAVVQANPLLEDQGQVQSGPWGTFIGIYDGHNGPDVSRYISQHLFSHLSRFASQKGGMCGEVLQMAFNATEQGFESLVVEAWSTAPQIATVGSCCLVGVINDGTVYIANAGDSRAVLGSIFPAIGEIIAMQLTNDHNAAQEIVHEECRSLHPDDSRIVLQKCGVQKVKGIIQVSEAIGDMYLKKQEFNREPICAQFRLSEPLVRPVLTAEPQLHVHKLQPEDRFLIFASDGFWDHLSNEDAVRLVNKHPQKAIARRLVRVALEEAARKREMRYSDLKMIQRGIRRHFHDDVIVVFIDHEARDDRYHGSDDENEHKE
ncbi:hypothetical protein KP509_21G024400 [Ceratopteris richardii]|uniref:PPM-type phosphatase domain-containing protein n=1 Tax=Ceratopteris richardii TaxID=49495 RepID=A0A8T2S8F6_CERRI|nr:hypothetical protein KP509_21G024400 [Ceratopteris richardii]